MAVEADPPGWRAGSSSDNGPLRIVRGRVNTTVTATILSGAGFTINRTGVGLLTVTYSTAFPTGLVPAVTLTGEGDATSIIEAGITNGGNVVASFTTQLYRNTTNAAVDGIFNFHVIGLASP